MDTVSGNWDVKFMQLLLIWTTEPRHLHVGTSHITKIRNWRICRFWFYETLFKFYRCTKTGNIAFVLFEDKIDGRVKANKIGRQPYYEFQWKLGGKIVGVLILRGVIGASLYRQLKMDRWMVAKVAIIGVLWVFIPYNVARESRDTTLSCRKQNHFDLQYTVK